MILKFLIILNKGLSSHFHLALGPKKLCGQSCLFWSGITITHHWNHPPGRSHPGFSLPSFPHLIMLFHAKQGITFPPFQRVDFHLSINYYSRFIYSSDTDCCPAWYRRLRVIIFIFILRPASVTLSLHAILSLSPKWLWASWRLILFSFYLLFPGLHLAYRKYFLMFIK